MGGVLIILRGLPGSGKTSFAKYMFSNNVFEADQYFTDTDGNYNFDATKLHAAHTDCQTRVEKLMQMSETTQYGHEIVVSNTATTEKELKPYYDLAEKYEYKVVSLIVENRHDGKNEHGVPDEKLEQMRNRFSIKL